jgi:hypothetical protein
MPDNLDQFDAPSQPVLPGNTVPGTPVDETGSTAAPDNPSTTPDPAAPPPTPPQPNAVEQNRSNITNPQLPAGGQVNPVLQTVDPNLVRNPNQYTLAPQPEAIAQTRFAAPGLNPPPKPEAETVNAKTVSGETPQATAQQGTLSDGSKVVAEQQQGLSTELKSTLDNFNAELDAIGVDPNMTVQGQYTQLMSGFDNGGTPPWAAAAMKRANQIMANRGMGASSMAAEAITSAMMQAALPIAAQDAQVFKDLKLAKLDKKAQGVFLRAGFISQLDMTNLNNRQQAAVVNAQSFLAMDMKNLDNRQQTAIVNTQARLQTLLSDQAAINSAQQFNAASKNQINQFYAGMQADIAKFNSVQTNEMERFNAGEVNAMTKFNAEQSSIRDRFNVGNQVLIDQSNLVYQRGINTSNNAIINQANMVNSTNLVNISNTAMANEIQLWRDGASYMFQQGENDKDRALQMSINGTQNAEWFKRYNTQQKGAFWSGVGNFLFNAGSNILEDWLDDDEGSGSTSGPSGSLTSAW